jgi:hypothetical protein
MSRDASSWLLSRRGGSREDIKPWEGRKSYSLIELKEGGYRQRTLRNVLEELSLFSPDFYKKLQIINHLLTCSSRFV